MRLYSSRGLHSIGKIKINKNEGFNFIQDDCPRWIRRFERFRKGSGLQSKSEENQVNALIYVMGDKADDILNSFGLSDDERKVYRTVKEKFDDYFEPQRNVIFQRAKFNQRKQLPGESVDDFITDLHCLADRCNYGDLRNEMVRDRIYSCGVARWSPIGKITTRCEPYNGNCCDSRSSK